MVNNEIIIRKVLNGYIVHPKNEDAMPLAHADVRVFSSCTMLCEWLKREFAIDEVKHD